MTRKLLSTLLALALCLSLLPSAALAEEADAVDTPAAEQQTEPQDTAVPEDSGTPDAPEEDESEPEGETDEAMLSVQALINALPGADELDDMDADELDAAYADTQAAYDAYEALTEAQQALVTGADCFEALFGWFNAQAAPLADISGPVDAVNDQSGAITNIGGTRSGPKLTEDTAKTTLKGKFYVVNESMTINGNLTVDGDTDGGLVLGEGVTLTVSGALIHEGGNHFQIFGASDGGDNAGRLVIENSSGDGAAIRSEAASAPQLQIGSGELEIHGNGQKLVDNVKLYSASKVHKGLLDGNTTALGDWSNNPSVSGGKLVIEYCGHDGSWYEPSGDTQHTKHCDDCGFAGKAKDCDGSDGVDGYVSGGETGHYQKCACGNTFGALIPHAMTTIPTKNGTKHISGCGECDYTSGSQDDHTWGHDAETGKATGECTVCHFAPVAEDAYLNLYGSVTEALKEVAKGGGSTDYVKLIRDSYTSGTVTEINENIVFDQPGKTVELKMNGHTLTNGSGAVLTVEAGTLRITDDAVITQTGEQWQDQVNSAVVVTGGTLIFDGKLTAQGGLYGTPGNARTCASAVYANGGELEFNGDLDLNGGLTVTGSAALAKGLSKGTFRIAYGSETVTGPRVSVAGSENYRHVGELLAADHAFVDNADKTTFKCMDAGYKEWSGDVTIVEHKHTWQKPDSGDIYVCKDCGASCTHDGGFKTGKCEVCGKPCPHDMADQSPVDHHYYCNECSQQMFARIQTDTYKWAHYTNLVDAFNAAENGQTVTLLDDINNYGKYACIIGNDKTVTLDLKGHNINGGWIFVGRNQDGDILSSSRLNITGSGSFETSGNLTITPGSTLDLSGWTGSKITRVNLSKSGEDESGLIVGDNAGTIEALEAYNWPTGEDAITYITNTKLSGGSYGAISITMKSGTGANKAIPYSSMLAPGYAFRYVESGEFVEYAAKAEYGNGGGSLYNVKVVKCPHPDAKGGVCLYCNTSGIAAMVGDTIYDNVGDAVTAWLENGGTLKLLDDYGQGASGNSLDLISAKAKWLTIDLNGHTFYKDCTGIKLGSKTLTITDSSSKDTGVFGSLEADSSDGTLILESGRVQKLTVPSSSTATITLRGGQLDNISCPLPVYKLLPNGYALMQNGVPVDPTAILDASGEFTVRDAQTLLVGDSKKVTVSYGQNTLPFGLGLMTEDSAVSQIQFIWHLVDDAGFVKSTLVITDNTEPSGGVYTYDTAATGTDALSSLTPGTYKAVCAVSGLDSTGARLWITTIGGCEFTVEAADLADAVVTFKNADGTENTSNRITFNPFGDTAAVPDTDFTVTCGGRTLKYDTDYKVSGNTADSTGYKELTVSPASGNYTGTKTVRWRVMAYVLSTPVCDPTVTKQYDGTTSLPDSFVTSEFMSHDESETRTVTLIKGTDYIVTDAHYLTPDAGDGKEIRYTVRLLNGNYQFGSGMEQEFDEAWIQPVSASITKADAPAAERGTFEIPNRLGKTYEIDLFPYLPALPDGCEYGEVTYSELAVVLPSQYYSYMPGLIEAKLENGKLILPILKNSETRTGGIGEIQMQVSSANYGDFLLYIDVNATNKTVPVGQPTLSKAELTYGEKLGSITLSGTLKDPDDGSEVPGTFEWLYPEEIPEPGKPWADWKFTPDDAEKYLEIDDSTQITVNKVTPTGEPKYTAITENGKTLADALLTADGGTFSIPGTVQWVDANGTELDVATAVEANTAYTWRFIPEDAEHYSELTGAITLYVVSDSGDSDDDGGSGSGGSGSSGGSSGTAGSTGTVTNPDGSTTRTETKPDGTTIETTTKPDGSTTRTETKIETKRDGTTVETVTETTTAPDGTSASTETTTEVQPDGSIKETTTASNGSNGTVTTDPNGKTTGSAGISEKAVEDAKKSGEAVKAPVEVKAGENSSTAPTIDIMLPAGAGETKVEIPVKDVNSGTVAIIVHPDGTEEIDKSGTVTETGVEISVSGSATVKIVDNSKDFIDTRDHWSKDDVNFVASRELFIGVGNNRFGVGDSMTRGMVNTVLARLAGVDTTPESGSKWYAPGTAWAKSNGITDGTNLTGAVTREQLAAMLYRYAGSPEVSGSLSFEDAPSASGYAQDALLWATKMGVLNGVGGNRLAPKEGASREQVAAMLARYLKNA